MQSVQVRRTVYTVVVFVKLSDLDDRHISTCMIMSTMDNILYTLRAEYN